VLVLTFCLPSWAGLSGRDLDGLGAVPPANATLPLTLGFVDEQGRPVTLADALSGTPAVVIFADYTCRTLCGPIVEFAAAGLAQSGLRPGEDYRLIIIGLDPRDGLDSARAMRSAHIGRDAVGRAAIFLTGEEPAIRRATDALGLSYRYDAERDQFAHPAAAYVVDREGRVTRVLSGLGLDGADLRLALVDAGKGSIGTLADRVRLLCYGYDPVRGIYSERITTFLEAGSGITVVMLLGSVLAMLAFERRKAAS
jgi:protein SCO1/2